MTERQSGQVVKLFCSYSHEDEQYRSSLKKWCNSIIWDDDIQFKFYSDADVLPSENIKPSTEHLMEAPTS